MLRNMHCRTNLLILIWRVLPIFIFGYIFLVKLLRLYFLFFSLEGFLRIFFWRKVHQSTSNQTGQRLAAVLAHLSLKPDKAYRSRGYCSRKIENCRAKALMKWNVIDGSTPTLRSHVQLRNGMKRCCFSKENIPFRSGMHSYLRIGGIFPFLYAKVTHAHLPPLFSYNFFC
jgi:hypothetical protein